MSRFQQAILTELSRLRDQDKKLRATVEELTASVAKLKEDAKPPELFKSEPLPRPDIYRDMVAANPEVLKVGEAMAGVLRDHLGRGNIHSQSRSMLPPAAPAPAVARGSGYAESKPLRVPDGVRHIDSMCEASSRQEALEKAVARSRLARDHAEAILDEMPLPGGKEP